MPLHVSWCWRLSKIKVLQLHKDTVPLFYKDLLKGKTWFLQMLTSQSSLSIGMSSAVLRHSETQRRSSVQITIPTWNFFSSLSGSPIPLQEYQRDKRSVL